MNHCCHRPNVDYVICHYVVVGESCRRLWQVDMVHGFHYFLFFRIFCWFRSNNGHEFTSSLCKNKNQLHNLWRLLKWCSRLERNSRKDELNCKEYGEKKNDADLSAAAIAFVFLFQCASASAVIFIPDRVCVCICSSFLLSSVCLLKCVGCCLLMFEK